MVNNTEIRISMMVAMMVAVVKSLSRSVVKPNEEETLWTS